MSRRKAAVRTAALLVVLVPGAASVAKGGTFSDASRSVGAGHCKVVAKGSPWSYKGQKGTTYTIEGDKASSCALGVKWLVRLTNISGVPRTPPGWDCITATPVTGECDGRKGGVFEWIGKAK
jgi:hypothetical protein